MYVPVRFMAIVGPCRLARADKCLQQRLQILSIGRRMLVQNDEIYREPLHPPVLVRTEQLPNNTHVLGIVDPNEHDWEIA